MPLTLDAAAALAIACSPRRPLGCWAARPLHQRAEPTNPLAPRYYPLSLTQPTVPASGGEAGNAVAMLAMLWRGWQCCGDAGNAVAMLAILW